MRRRIVILAATIATVVSGPTTVAAAGAATGDQDRADAAIMAFATDVEAAGYVSTGPAEDGDILDLVPDKDASAQDAAAYRCLGDLPSLVSDDGTFVGETARTLSDNYEFAAGGVPPTTDPLSFSIDENSISAAVMLLDDQHAEAVGAVVEAFGSAKVRDCLNEYLTELNTTDSSDTTGTIETTNSNDLGVGDQSSMFSVHFSFSIAGEKTELGTSVAMARVDRALALVISVSSGRAGGLPPEDALANIVDSLGK